MAYQVVYKIQGEALKETNNVFDPNKSKGQEVINIFNAYVGKEWITQYDRKDITETHVEDTLVFVSKEKRDAFKAEMEAVTADKTEISLLTIETLSEGEV
tara:strand:+ start:781 stop:1080 length:300 start_codon:yes stop_codon:yes gene_type:complete